MSLNESWLPAQWPAATRVHAGTTTRLGGLSRGVYAGFNLATHVDDDPQAVQQNRQLLQTLLQLPSAPVWLTQVHGKVVVAAHEVTALVAADASFTDQADVVCAVMTADCLPVFFTDVQGRYVAIAHAGWRGLVQGILTATLDALPVVRDQIMVWLGPGIGPTAFEVGEDVYAAFTQRAPIYAQAFVRKDPDHWWLNAYTAARLELQLAGVNAVYGGDLCTYSDAQRFYSYRRDHHTGRMASLIWLAAA